MLHIIFLSLVGTALADLDLTCYPNGTISVTHPSSYSHCFSVQDQGLSSAVKCSVSTSGSVSIITGCSLGKPIVVFFSHRSGSVDTFSSKDYLSCEIECDNIADPGVDRTVSNFIRANMGVTTQDAVTPSFFISSALRDPDQLGSPVYEEPVGEEIYWTIDIPSDYTASPTCYAYSGSDASGSPSMLLVQDGCRQDSDLLGGDFDSVETSIPLIKRYYVNLYVFKFYNSDDVFFKCTMKLCPSGSSSCDINCSRWRRSISIDAQPNSGANTYITGNIMHVLSTSSAGSLSGSVWLCVVVSFCTINRK